MNRRAKPPLAVFALAVALIVGGCAGTSSGSTYWREDLTNGSSLYMSVVVDGENVSGWAKYLDGSFQHYNGTKNSDGTYSIGAYTGQTLSMDGSTMTATPSNGHAPGHWKKISKSEFRAAGGPASDGSQPTAVTPSSGNQAATPTTTSEPAQSGPGDANSSSNVIGQASLRPAKGGDAPRAVGIAQFVTQGSQEKVNIVAEGLPAAPRGTGYAVWLISDTTEPAFLGYITAVTSGGQAAARSALSVNPREYRAVRITRDAGTKPTQPGKSVLEGPIRFPSK